MELCYRNISGSFYYRVNMGNKNIATKLLLQFVDRKIYVSVWYEFLLKGTSEHTLIQSYVSMIT